ncbi:alpha/beta hydrolase fold domain-containing protein [Streptomyces sp. NPDC001970]
MDLALDIAAETVGVDVLLLQHCRGRRLPRQVRHHAVRPRLAEEPGEGADSALRELLSFRAAPSWARVCSSSRAASGSQMWFCFFARVMPGQWRTRSRRVRTSATLVPAVPGMPTLRHRVIAREPVVVIDPAATIDSPVELEAVAGAACILGPQPADRPPSPPAADLSGLPPAYVNVAQFGPLRDEGIEYARRLARSNVPVELHLFPGTFHSSAMAADTAVSPADAGRDGRRAARRPLKAGAIRAQDGRGRVAGPVRRGTVSAEP